MTPSATVADLADQRHPDFDSEQAFLTHAAECLETMRVSAKRLPEGGGDKKATRALIELSQKRVDELDRLQAIAFGRIDTSSGETHHIGAQLIWDGTTPAVISWAAPEAARFYTATPSDPEGIELRRRLQTNQSTLLSISDERLTEAVQPIRDDALLRELERQRTGSMSEIAATIQQQQYQLITLPSDQTTVVQGAPGTGKTAVGLQRAALLLFRNRGSRVPSRILILGPNPVFIQYIQQVLPALGESDVDQLPISALGGVDVRATDDSRVRLVKGGSAMAEVLRRATVQRVRVPEDGVDIAIGVTTFVIPSHEVSVAVADFDPASRPYNQARDRFRREFLGLVADAYLRHTGHTIDFDDLRTDPGYLRALDRVWPTITAEELVRQLLSSEERLARAGADLLSDVDQNVLHRKVVATLDQVEWSDGDVALLDEARYLLEGRPTGYWHVVVDEAQDLTPMELRMVGRRVVAGAATILGDLAQSTGSYDYESWEDLLQHTGLAGAAIEELLHAYRVPKQIMDVALPILLSTAPTTTTPISYREGPSAPSWMQVAPEERSRKAVAMAVTLQASGGTTAIIAPRSLLDGLRQELNATKTSYEDGELNELGTSIELLDPTVAKGLEFDHVVLVEPGAIVREQKNGRGLQALYIALTRPTQTLTCVHSQRLPWPLGL